MALIVEDGTGKSNAESYISVSAATTYHADRGNAAWAALANDTVREQLLRKATDYMAVYRYRWAGDRKTATQALDWPRIDVPRRDGPRLLMTAQSYYANDAVPVEVQRACAELALKAATIDLSPDVDRITTREQVGPIAVEYAAGGTPWVQFRSVDNTLAGLMKPGNGTSIRVERV